MRRHVVAASVAAVLVATAACTADRVIAPGDASQVVVRAKTLASTAALVVEISGPGIDPALLFNIPVGPDTVAQDTLSVPSGGARRFVVTAVDTLGVSTHRADTTLALQPGVHPGLALVLRPLPIESDSASLVPASLSAGADHTCGLATDGSAYCWGVNAAGQLGDGTFENRASPTAVLGGKSFVAISAGLAHTCAITESGAAFCWGANSQGQLGNGAFTNQPTPAAVSGSVIFAEIAAGGEHTCGLSSSGTAYCWGVNSYGQLGDPNGSRSVPGSPIAGVVFRSIATGQWHTCGVATSGAAYCWGRNEDGQLGDGSAPASKNRPALVSGGLAFKSLTLGQGHTCGVATAGWGSAAYCWGNGSLVGDGDPGSAESTPKRVDGGYAFRWLKAGSSHTCGVLLSGATYCWGANNSGQLGDGTSVTRLSPVAVSGGPSFAALAAGVEHSCGLTEDGTAFCWGGRFDGRIGDGALVANFRTEPGPVAGGLVFSSLLARNDHSCGIAVGGTAYCWGGNGFGQRGDGTTATSPGPVAVSGGRTYTKLAGSYTHTCGLTDVGAVYCWGQGGRLGDGTIAQSLVPVAVVGGLTFTSIVGGTTYTCGLTNSGAAYCWGESNGEFRLGDSTRLSRREPAPVSGGLSFVSLAAGGHTCGLTSTGAAYCWGRNNVGQLGNGTVVAAGSPVPVSGGLSFQSLQVGLNHTCGLTTGGEIYCWGGNNFGQLGDGTRTDRRVPIAVGPGLSFSALAEIIYYHTCALTVSGAALCWGANEWAQLGDGTPTSRTSATTSATANQPAPVAVLGGLSFVRLDAGLYHTCGLTGAGGTYCWGRNTSLQLGDGYQPWAPQSVTGGISFRIR